MSRTSSQLPTACLAMMLLTAAEPALAITYNCLPVQLVDEVQHIRVECARPGQGEGEPLDGTQPIYVFAVPHSQADLARRFEFLAQTAIAAGMVLQFQYTSGALAAGCNAADCRKPWAIGLLSPGRDVRIPFVAWPASTIETVTQGSWRVFGPFGISEHRRLVVTMAGSGNADLYVRRDLPPTTTDATCKVTNSTSTGNLTINGPKLDAKGVPYYIGVLGVASVSAYQLNVTIPLKAAGAVDDSCTSP